MSEPGYRGPQVCKIVGITYRQLDYWARTGLVRPSVMDAQGSGTQRLYSWRDLVVLKVIKQMLDAGISLQSARRRSSRCAPSTRISRRCASCCRAPTSCSRRATSR
jgi:DNA-binding transcriptional MerR regulator